MNNKKVLLILADGMRPDAFLNCGNTYINDIMAKAYYTLDGNTTFPSVTLPCHISLFLSVPTERHGISTNLYIPPVRPVDSLFDQLKKAGAVSAMYYSWQPLRDVASPNSLKFSEYINSGVHDAVDSELTENAITRIKKNSPDFVFLYLGDTDKIGHSNGWMSDEYLRTVSRVVDNIRRVIEECSDEYTIIITADHGGHDRIHGTELSEDMNIPMFYIGKDFQAGTRFSGGSILDITPTIAKLMDILPAEDWEGKPIF